MRPRVRWLSRSLLPRPALDVFEIGLALFRFLPLGLADDEGTAAYVLGFVNLIVCQYIPAPFT
jgi:hypothetical protein